MRNTSATFNIDISEECAYQSDCLFYTKVHVSWPSDTLGASCGSRLAHKMDTESVFHQIHEVVWVIAEKMATTWPRVVLLWTCDSTLNRRRSGLVWRCCWLLHVQLGCEQQLLQLLESVNNTENDRETLKTKYFEPHDILDELLIVLSMRPSQLSLSGKMQNAHTCQVEGWNRP